MAIKYKWLAARIRDLIDKNIQDGINRLPTEQELCKKYKVSRQTVRTALSVLEKERLIVRKQGSGSYITGRSANPGKDIIAVLISSDQDYIYPDMLNGIHNTLLQNGYVDHVYVTREHTFTERQILLGLLDSLPRGILAEGCKSALPNPNLSLYRELADKGCTILFFNSYYKALQNCLYVTADNFSGSVLLARHLLELGHTCAAGIFRYDDLQGIERFRGFSEAFNEARLAVSDEQIFWFGAGETEQLQHGPRPSFIKEIVRKLPDSCTAVVCHNDVIAYALIKELGLAGYRLPEDIAVVSFDDSYLSNSDYLSVTSLSHGGKKPGNVAAQMLADKLKGLPANPQEIPWELHIKESTAGRKG